MERTSAESGRNRICSYSSLSLTDSQSVSLPLYELILDDCIIRLLIYIFKIKNKISIEFRLDKYRDRYFNKTFIS